MAPSRYQLVSRQGQGGEWGGGVSGPASQLRKSMRPGPGKSVVGSHGHGHGLPAPTPTPALCTIYQLQEGFRLPRQGQSIFDLEVLLLVAGVLTVKSHVRGAGWEEAGGDCAGRSCTKNT